MLTHGHRRTNRHRTPTYNSWRGMIERCTRESHPFFEHYGGRGITVCGQWRGKGGFARFLADVGERPEGRTLDRIDVDGNYEPGNVRWATGSEQRWNRRDMRAMQEQREPIAAGASTPASDAPF